MGRQNGSAMILSIFDGGSPGNYLVVGGLKQIRFTTEAGVANISSLSSGAWRKLAASQGERRLTIEASGVFATSAGESLLFTRACDQGFAVFRLSQPDGKKIEGNFLVSRYLREARRDESISAELTLLSSDVVTVEV